MTGFDRALREAYATVELPGGVLMPFCMIPACPEGFWMGSRGYRNDEEPRHRVVISKPFLMGSAPVTQEQFAAFRQEHKSGFSGEKNLPVECVSWEDAVAFCRWLERRFTLPVGFASAGLPTEAQWEYACRRRPVVGGHKYAEAEYWSGDGETALEGVGWYHENSENRTHPVCEKAANGFGLYDLHGNVWEWCRDEWAQNAYRLRGDGLVDPLIESAGDETSSRGELEQSLRVLRGGSWLDSAGFCRSGFRGWNGAGFRDWDDGFRVCLFPGPAVAGGAEQSEASGAAKRGRSGAGGPDQDAATRRSGRLRKKAYGDLDTKGSGQ